MAAQSHRSSERCDVLGYVHLVDIRQLGSVAHPKDVCSNAMI